LGKYLSTSLIFKSSHGLYHYFSTSYTYKVLRVLLNWWRHSEINQFIAKYMKRSSSLKYSATYELCARAFSTFDSLWDRLYAFTVKNGKSSYVISFIRKTFCSTSSSIAYSLFILFFSCGFSVTSIILETFNNIKAVLLALGLLTSTFLLVGKSSWTACRKGSLFWRIAQYIFD